MQGEFIIFSVFDNLTQTFLQPVFIETREEALRLFKYQINNTPIWKDNPSDYDFYILGIFNQNTGEIKSLYEKIANGYSVKDKEEKE